MNCDAASTPPPGQTKATHAKRLLGISYDEADAAAGKPIPFDLNRAHQLHEVLLGPFKDIVRGKHLLIVVSDALAAIPFLVLVSDQPTKSVDISPKDYERVRWLGVEQPISTLPSVASLKLLRSLKKETHAPEPYIGFGAPCLKANRPLDRR